MNFNLLQGVTGRKPGSLDRLRVTRRDAARTADDKGQRAIPRLPSLSWLPGSWEVRLLERLHGVILRNRKRHLESALWHSDLVRKREKQADHIGIMAAAVLARTQDGNEETR